MTTLSASHSLTVKPASAARRRPKHVLRFVLMTAFALLWLVPVFAAIVTSVRTQADITMHGFWSLPGQLTLDNYARAWQQAKVSRFLLNSFIITLPSVLFVLLFASVNAFALAKYRFRGGLFFYFMFVAGSMLPNQILMLPVFKLSNELGIYNTHANLIIVHVAWHMAFATFVLRNFMTAVPDEIMESARLDGCSEFGIYWRMILPLVLPGLAAIATLEFTWIFNDYLWSIILSRSDSVRPITAGLAQLRGTFQTDWPVIVSGAILASVPTTIVFFALQRYFISGLTLGSNK